MEDKKYLTWVNFYVEFASKLLAYKNDRKTLINLIRSVHKERGLKLSKIDSSDYAADIDPFTVFGLFNKRITAANRISLLNGFAKAFSVKAAVPKNFDGVPVLNNLNAVFYKFSDDPERGENDIDNLWNVFEAAVAYADDETPDNRTAFITAYDLVKDLKGNRFKLTIGLYWIRPFNFINLDFLNRRFIIKNSQTLPPDCVEAIKNLKNDLPDGKSYDAIRSTFINALKTGEYKYDNFPELSHNAWIVSEKNKREQKKERTPTERENTGASAADENNTDGVRYWIYSPGRGASMWKSFYNEGIIAIGWEKLGDFSAYSSKDEITARMKELYGADSSHKNDSLAVWQFANEMKSGDIAFVKKGSRQILGRGVVVSDYKFDANRDDRYKNIRRINWTHKGEWTHPGQAVLKTLTDITGYSEYVAKLNKLFESDAKEESPSVEAAGAKPYTREDFLNEVYMSPDDYDALLFLLKHKKNVVLQGAPGVGKTFAAKRLAYSILGKRDDDRVASVQFHQSYSYEDFIMGYKPDGDGFTLKFGAFYEFCKKAEKSPPDEPFFFLIDEINRGNLSKIFGELLSLVEKDYRGIKIRPAYGDYGDNLISVPENLYIVGMMNTADRSLAIIDYALRRRFGFFNMEPAFDSEGFKKSQKERGDKVFDAVINVVKDLNKAIVSDPSLGKGFCIGHSYFCNNDRGAERLKSVVNYDIIPTLNEYWFDSPDKAERWSKSLRDACGDGK